MSSVSFAPDTASAWDGVSQVATFGLPNTTTYGQTIKVGEVAQQLRGFTFYAKLPATLAVRGYVYAWDGQKATGPALFESRDISTTNPDIFEPLTFDISDVTLVAGQDYVIFVSCARSEGGGGSGSLGQLRNRDGYSEGSFVYLNTTTGASEWTTQNWQQNFLGAGGDLAFKALVGLPLPNLTEFNIVTLQDLNFTSGEVEGRLAVGRAALFDSTSLASRNEAADAIYVQSDVSFGGGNQINGNLVYGGNLIGTPSFSKGGPVSQPDPLPLTALRSYVKSVADRWAALPVNGTTDVKDWGQIILTGSNAATNVFTVKGSDLTRANNLQIQAPNGATAIVNVTGNSTLSNMGIDYQGGLDGQHVALNFVDATELAISGIGITALVWAALASTSFINGTLNGTLVASSLRAGGSFKIKPFLGTLPT